MYRHEKTRCSNRFQKDDTQTHETAPPNAINIETHGKSNVIDVELIKAQISTEIQNATKQQITIELQKATETILSGVVDELNKSRSPAVSITNITNNIHIYLNKDTNVYDIKKQIVGASDAHDYICGLVTNATPNTKFKWIKDLIPPDEFPIARIDSNQYSVTIGENNEVIYDHNMIDKINSEIVANSVLKAISEILNPLLGTFYGSKEEDHYAFAYNGPFGKDIMGDIIRFRKISTTEKHLKEVCRPKK